MCITDRIISEKSCVEKQKYLYNILLYIYANKAKQKY